MVQYFQWHRVTRFLLTPRQQVRYVGIEASQFGETAGARLKRASRLPSF